MLLNSQQITLDIQLYVLLLQDHLLAGMLAFVWDGIFIGITQTRGMLQSSFVAAIVFFACVFVLMPIGGNHGLWIAMLLYLLMRGLVQTVIFYKRVVNIGKTR